VEEFDTFTMRENALSLVFCANKEDPEMNRILKMLIPLSNNINKLVIVDVGLLPQLGIRFDIKFPTLFKLYKGKIVNLFTSEFTQDCLRKFVYIQSTARWRSTNIR
jgi:hypothetical protein